MQTFSSEPRKIRSAYEPKPQVQLDCPEKPYGRTKQSFKAECDINTIIARFLKTGILDFTSKNQPRYGDTTGMEYTAACQTVAAAKSLFNELPAALRARFENEPAKFLDFVQDKRNADEARALGLLKEPVAAPAAAGAPTATSTTSTAQPAPQGTPAA